jgi:hypothetical protein
MTTERRDDPHEPTSAEDERFARWLGELYEAPPMTEARRRRFDARLEERLARARARPWHAALAAAAAALAFVLWGEHAAGPGATDPAPAAAASAEAVLALATEPVTDAEEALPVEYQAISYLLIDAKGGSSR